MSYDLHVKNTEGPRLDAFKQATRDVIDSAATKVSDGLSSAVKGVKNIGKSVLRDEEDPLAYVARDQTPVTTMYGNAVRLGFEKQTPPINEANRRPVTPTSKQSSGDKSQTKSDNNGNDTIKTKLTFETPIHRNGNLGSVIEGSDTETNVADPGTPPIFTNSNVLAKRGTFLPTSFVKLPSDTEDMEDINKRVTLYGLLKRLIVYYNKDNMFLCGPFVCKAAKKVKNDQGVFDTKYLMFEHANDDDPTIIMAHFRLDGSFVYARIWDKTHNEPTEEFVTLLIPDCKTIDDM
jgi:hypothetical protein